MGVITKYHGYRNNAHTCKIDWEKWSELQEKPDVWYIEDAFKKQIQTLDEFGAIVEDRKFIGYFDDDDYKAFAILSKCLIPNGCFPRLYFGTDCDDDGVCLEFHPTTNVVMYGTCSFRKLYEEKFPDQTGDFAELHNAWMNTLTSMLPDLPNWTFKLFKPTPPRAPIDYSNLRVSYTQI